MKRRDFIRQLERDGCYLGRHGKRHDVYVNPVSGANAAVPRHTELGASLCRVIRKELGLPPADR